LDYILSGYCNLYKQVQEQEYLDKINFFLRQLSSLVTNCIAEHVGVIIFDWQAKAFFQPKTRQPVVATSFIACALLDAYEITGGRSIA